MARSKPIEESEIIPPWNVDAILTADVHLRDDQPICRTDDYFEAQAKKIKWLFELQEKYKCPILDAGDVFSKARPTPHLLGWAIRNLPNEFITIPGNHDLPEHSLSNLHKSGFDVLLAAGVIRDCTGDNWIESVGRVVGIPYGVPLEKYINGEYDVAIIHTMTYHGNTPWPGCQDPSAEELMERVPARLILTGHNHTPFVVQKGKKLLVNPGSLMRSSAAQADYEPHVYLYNTERNAVFPMPIPIAKGVVSREHIDAVDNKEERLSAFVSKLANNVEMELSFQANVERYLSTNRVRKGIKRVIERCL